MATLLVITELSGYGDQAAGRFPQTCVILER
jgi:hypothetical protein